MIFMKLKYMTIIENDNKNILKMTNTYYKCYFIMNILRFPSSPGSQINYFLIFL